jgi:GWxTD domain-containing protein
MWKKSIIIFLVLIGIYNKGTCDEIIYFNFDYAVFKSDNQQSILEIYYSVNQKTLKYVKTNDLFEAAAKISVSIFNITTNTQVYQKSFKTPTSASDTSDSKLNQKLVGQLNFLLPDGSYKMELTGSDFNDSSRFDFINPEIKIDNYSDSPIKISDIELANSVKKSENENSIFYKNTLEIIPNPSALFGMNLNELYYYYEIYGLTPENISDEYIMNYTVLNINNEKLVSTGKKFKRKLESKADYGIINIDSLNRGSYTLQITLLDSAKNLSITREKKFFVFNNNNQIPSVSKQDSYLKSEYVNMSEDDLENEFNYAKYIMSENEAANYEKLNTLSEKKNYLFAFWKSRDNNLNTQNIEYKTEYFKRVAEANKNYKEAYKEGWKTDRGRIYIIYGKPDDVERFPFESDSKSYEIWKYDSHEGGGECVFIERQSSTGVYYLAHCTFRNELSNDNWRKDLK